jgi:hypothetical protein
MAESERNWRNENNRQAYHAGMGRDREGTGRIRRGRETWEGADGEHGENRVGSELIRRSGGAKGTGAQYGGSTRNQET